VRRGVLVASVVAVGCRVAPTPSTDVGRPERVANGLRPAIVIAGEAPVRWALADRMRHYDVPGVSIAIIDSGRIVWAKGFGVKQAGDTGAVTAETLFEAGSVSKPTFAVGVMRLVQDGRLNLDENVNAKLVAWKVPDNKFTVREKVTLRRILSHNAGLGVHGFPGYEAGTPIPTVVQILNGEKPANTLPVRVDTTPGAVSSYSGGGLTVAMLVVTDVTKESLPDFMRTTVFEPLAMAHSTYEQPLPASRVPYAASGHTTTGAVIPGKYHTYPEMTAAGLWTTPSDLALLAIELQRAYAGQSHRVLDSATVAEMFTIQKAPFGIGYIIDGSGGPDLEFSHRGDDAGFKAAFIAFATRGQGAIIMTNGDQGNGLMDEIIAAIADEYEWPHHRPTVKTPVHTDSAALAAVAGIYQFEVGAPKPLLDTVTVEQGKLFARSGAIIPKVELLPDTGGTFFSRDDGTVVLFDRDPGGRVVGMTVPGVIKGPKIK
jgi:CubicO group peptidase (beta-lactamase class C family)